MTGKLIIFGAHCTEEAIDLSGERTHFQNENNKPTALTTAFLFIIVNIVRCLVLYNICPRSGYRGMIIPVHGYDNPKVKLLLQSMMWLVVVIRLSLGRRLVNLLPAAQRTNALTYGVVGRPWVVGREFESHVHHENAF